MEVYMLRSPLGFNGSRTPYAPRCRYKAPTIMYTATAIDTLDSHIDDPPANAIAPLSAPGTVWLTVMFFSWLKKNV